MTELPSRLLRGSDAARSNIAALAPRVALLTRITQADRRETPNLALHVTQFLTESRPRHCSSFDLIENGSSFVYSISGNTTSHA